MAGVVQHQFLQRRDRWRSRNASCACGQPALQRRHGVAAKVVVVLADRSRRAAAGSRCLRSCRTRTCSSLTSASRRAPATAACPRPAAWPCNRWRRPPGSVRWSSCIALAVSMMIGSFFHSARLRISRVAVRPSISGIITSISTRSIAVCRSRCRRCSQLLDRFAAVARDLDNGTARFQHAGQREDVAHVVLDHEDAAAFEQRVAAGGLARASSAVRPAARTRPGAGTASPRPAAARATWRP